LWSIYHIPISFETLSYFQLSSSISLSSNLSLPSRSLCDSRTDCMNSFSACTFARAFSAMSSLVKVLAITMECSSADVLPGVWNKILRLELFIRAIYSTRFLSFILKNKSQLHLSFFYQICQTYKNTNGFSNQLVDDREVKEFFFFINKILLMTGGYRK